MTIKNSGRPLGALRRACRAGVVAVVAAAGVGATASVVVAARHRSRRRSAELRDRTG